MSNYALIKNVPLLLNMDNPGGLIFFPYTQHWQLKKLIIQERAINLTFSNEINIRYAAVHCWKVQSFYPEYWIGVLLHEKL